MAGVFMKGFVGKAESLLRLLVAVYVPQQVEHSGCCLLDIFPLRPEG